MSAAHRPARSASTTPSVSGLIDVVNRGGDADTTGAILGMILGALYGPNALPARWVRRLERDVRLECLTQAQALIKRSPLCAAKAIAGDGLDLNLGRAGSPSA